MGDTFEFLPNYTGPWISNGKIQSSVEFGEKQPKDALDSYSRLHDSAYAKWDDRLHRTVADEIYNESVKELEGLFPEVARNAVLYGNHTARSGGNILEATAKYGPFGILIGGVQNMYDMNNYINNASSVKKEIREYYLSDPHVEFQIGGSKMDRNNVWLPSGEFFGKDQFEGISYKPKTDLIPDFPKQPKTTLLDELPSGKYHTNYLGNNNGYPVWYYPKQGRYKKIKKQKKNKILAI